MNGFDREARLNEFKIAEYIEDDTCFFLYKGRALVWCPKHARDSRECSDDCIAEWVWLVEPGGDDDFCLEVYNRADTEIFAPGFSRAKLAQLRAMLTV